MARWFLLKMAPSPRTARASGRARRGSAGISVLVVQTGPNRIRREGQHREHHPVPVCFACACESLPPLSCAESKAYWRESRWRHAAWASPLIAQSWPQGNFVVFSICWTRRVGCSTPLGLGFRVLAGPVEMGYGGGCPAAAMWAGLTPGSSGAGSITGQRAPSIGVSLKCTCGFTSSRVPRDRFLVCGFRSPPRHPTSGSCCFGLTGLILPF